MAATSDQASCEPNGGEQSRAESELETTTVSSSRTEVEQTLRTEQLRFGSSSFVTESNDGRFPLLLKMWEEASKVNIDIARDFERLLPLLQLSRNELNGPGAGGIGMDLSSSRSHLSDVQDVSMLSLHNSEKTQLERKLQEANDQNAKKLLLLNEKESIIQSLNKQLTEKEADPSSFAERRHLKESDLMYRTLIEVGEEIVRESDSHSRLDKASYQGTRDQRLVDRIKEALSKSQSESEGEADTRQLTSSLFEAIVVSLKALFGKRKIEADDLRGKLSASKEQVKVQKQFIDQTSEERQRLLRINAQLTSQLTECNRDLLLYSPRSSTPAFASETRGGQAILDQVKQTLKEQIETLNDENDKLHLLANEFRRSKEEMEDQLEEMRSRERVCRFERDQRQRDSNRFEEALEKVRTECKRLKESLHSLRLEKDSLEKTNTSIRKQLLASEGLQQDLEYEKGAVERKYQEVVNLLKAESEGQLSEHEEEMFRVKRDINLLESQMQEKIGWLEREKFNLEVNHLEEINHLAKEASEKEQLIAQIEARLEQETNQWNQLRDQLVVDMDRLRQEKEELEARLRAEISVSERKLVGLSSELNRVTSERREEGEKLYQEVDRLKSKLSQAENEKTVVLQSMRQVEDKLIACESKYREKCREVNEYKQLIELYEKEKHLKTEEMLELSHRLETNSREITRLKQREDELLKQVEIEVNMKSNLEKDISELHSTLRQVEASRVELKKELNTMRLKFSSLETNFSGKVNETKELMALLERKSEKQALQQQEIQQVNTNLLEIEAEKQTFRQEAVSLKHRLEEAEHCVKCEKSKIKKFEEEMKSLETEKKLLQTQLKNVHQSVKEMENTSGAAAARNEQLKDRADRLEKDKRVLEERMIRLNSYLQTYLRLGENRDHREPDHNMEDDLSVLDLDMYSVFDQAFEESLNKTLATSETPETGRDLFLFDPEFIRSALIDLLTKFDAASKESSLLKSAEEKYRQVNYELESIRKQLDRSESFVNEKHRELASRERETNSLKEKLSKNEELVVKHNKERKQFCDKISDFSDQLERLQKEKKKLSQEICSLKAINTSNESLLINEKEKVETKVKHLERAKESAESRVNDVVKSVNRLNQEKNELKQELNILNHKIKELQGNNLRLTSDLTASNLALRRASEGEKELHNKLIGVNEEKDVVSGDILKQLQRLKTQVNELKEERGSLQLVHQQSLDSSRVKQLQAEISLTATKRRESESQLSLKSDIIVNKEAKINELQKEIEALEERNKRLATKHSLRGEYLTDEKSRRKVKSQTRSTFSKEMEGQSSAIFHETSAITDGLVALEEENVKLQRKVKSLQNLMNEAESHSFDRTKGSSWSSTISLEAERLRAAQQQAESLLHVREKTHKKHVNNLEQEIGALRQQLSSTLSMASSPSSVSRFRSPSPSLGSPPKREAGRQANSSFLLTSTPIETTSNGNATALRSELNVSSHSHSGSKSSKRNLNL